MGLIKDIWNYPAGPKTIFFWAPTAKWGISFANIADFSKPPETVSYPYQSAMAGSALIWCRYSMVIMPKNYNLLAVNTLMIITSSYQLYCKISHGKEQQIAGPRIGKK
ncbi:unnamed protein product [Calypogeia fissa]